MTNVGPKCESHVWLEMSPKIHFEYCYRCWGWRSTDKLPHASRLRDMSLSQLEYESVRLKEELAKREMFSKRLDRRIARYKKTLAVEVGTI